MPLVIPNTTVTPTTSGSQYYVKANEGYVLHDNTYDEPIFDDFGNEIGTKIVYRSTRASIGINRDLSERICIDENGNQVTGYTEREFYTKLRNEVPEDHINNVDGPEHEVM